MPKLALSLVAVLALAACKKSRCETYADMEVKCSGHEGELVHKMAEGMCEEADKNPGKDMMTQMFSKQADCAAKHKECDAYKACLDGIKLDMK